MTGILIFLQGHDCWVMYFKCAAYYGANGHYCYFHDKNVNSIHFILRKDYAKKGHIIRIAFIV